MPSSFSSRRNNLVRYQFSGDVADVPISVAMTNELPFNLFDGAVYLCLAVVIIAGLRSGLMRSLATIVGYLIAAPLAVALPPYVTPLVNARFPLTPSQLPLVFFAVVVAIGFLL